MKELHKKRIFLSLILMMFAFCLIFNTDVSAAKKKKYNKRIKVSKSVKPTGMKTFITYYNLNVGETRDIKVAPKKATIKVQYLPTNAKRTGISVKSSNSGIVKITRKNEFYYKFTAKKKGSVTLTISSLKNAANGKKLQVKVRIRVDDPKPIRSITAAKNGVSQIRVNFDTVIKNRFDISKLVVTRYDDRDEKQLETLSIKNFEYVKDDEFGVLLNLVKDLESHSNYHIQYDGMFASFETGKIGVNRIEVVNKKIPKNMPSKIVLKAFDIEGNDVTETGFFKKDKVVIKLLDATSNATRLEGIGINSKLYMIETGSKANIEISYDDIKLKEEITCDDMVDSSLNNVYKNVVVYGTDSINWDIVKENELAKLDLSKKDASIALLLKASDGKLISNKIYDKNYDPKATFTYSVNKGSKIKVDEKTGAISANKAGNYGVKVTMNYNGNNYQYYVSIKAEDIKLGAVTLDYPEITVSNRNGIKYVNLRCVNIYGGSIEERDMKYTPVITYKNADAKSSNKNSEPDALKGLVELKENKKLTIKIDATGRKPSGTYYYEIVIGDPKKETVKTYLTVKVQDSTTDDVSFEYRFKDVLEKPHIDLRIGNELSLNDIETIAKGVDLSLYSYNQFGTPVGVAPTNNFKINGKYYDPATMPYIVPNSNGGFNFVPIAIEKRTVGGGEVTVIKKIAPTGGYNISTEVYNTRYNRMQTYSCSINVTDTQGTMVENSDFKVKRAGINGAPTILQSGMSGTPSMIARQLVTKMDDSVFMPEIEATAFDVRYPNVKAYTLVAGNRYVIDYVYLPMPVVTRDRTEIFVYQQHRLDIMLGTN